MTVIRYSLAVVLALACLFMGFKLFKEIQEPIVFEKQKTERDQAAIDVLKKIRQAQLAYKGQYGYYAADFDTLFTVVNTDSFEVVKTIGDPNDSTIVVKQELSKIAIVDSLFDGERSMVTDLRYVPNTDPRKEWNIDAKIITKNEVEIPAFQVGIPYRVIYNGLIKKYYADKADDLMAVGSLKEGTTAGTWDKLSSK